MSIDYPYPQVHMVDWVEGVEWERERIVNLLEASEKHNYLLLGNNDGLERKHSFFCDLCKRIALIKGENK